MTIEEKLDLILAETKEQYGHLPINAHWEKICRLVTGGNGISTGNPDYKNDPFFNMLLKGLTDEKYIQEYTNKGENPPLTYNLATVKGLTFKGFKKTKKVNEGAKRREISEKIAIAFISIIATALVGFWFRPSEKISKQETLILPPIQIVHDTVFVSSISRETANDCKNGK